MSRVARRKEFAKRSKKAAFAYAKTASLSEMSLRRWLTDDALVRTVRLRTNSSLARWPVAVGHQPAGELAC